MKLLKTLTLGLLAAAGLAGTASAATQVYVHIVGSTAFRAPTTAAIIDVLSNGGTTTVYAGDTTGNLLSAGAAVIANGTLNTSSTTGTATIVVETYWTGSLAGLVDLVAGNNTGAYIDASDSATATQINGGALATGAYLGGATLSSPAITTHAPDMAMSDSVNTTIASELGTGATLSAPIGSYSTIAALATACGGSTVIDGGTSNFAAGAGHVGIVPFEWIEGNGGPSLGANSTISQQTARSLITKGFIPQSFLTGGSASPDTSNYFYLIGRNEDSGTRIGALMESQFGVTTSPKQYALAGSTANLYPVTALNTEPNIKWNTTAHSGYASGGNVASALEISGGAITFTNGKAPKNSGSSYFIGYLGITDALGATGNGCTALSYAGVPYSIAAVQNGSYTFWTYEHSYHLSTLSDPTILPTVDAIADTIYSTDADIAGDGTHSSVSPFTVSAGILDNSKVLVSRNATEGLPLSKNGN